MNLTISSFTDCSGIMEQVFLVLHLRKIKENQFRVRRNVEEIVAPTILSAENRCFRIENSTSENIGNPDGPFAKKKRSQSKIH